PTARGCRSLQLLLLTSEISSGIYCLWVSVATHFCSLNKKCVHLRTYYASSCTKGAESGDTCDQRKCHKRLRQFFEKVPEDFTKRLLFCPCQDELCGERRRKTIVPECSFQDSIKPNCLLLLDSCIKDHICNAEGSLPPDRMPLSAEGSLPPDRMPLSAEGSLPPDRMPLSAEGSLPPDRMPLSAEGSLPPTLHAPQRRGVPAPRPHAPQRTAMTPNYVGNSSTEVSLWCTCENSGNQQEECDQIRSMFISNKCLIQGAQKINSNLTHHSLAQTISLGQQLSNSSQILLAETG
uniref:GDNF family receptor alpha 3 n=1 Tax=Gopherus evgoodei TaxID=1825980 RepID=A0A8C4WNA1_9SAUR